MHKRERETMEVWGHVPLTPWVTGSTPGCQRIFIKFLTTTSCFGLDYEYVAYEAYIVLCTSIWVGLRGCAVYEYLGWIGVRGFNDSLRHVLQ